MPKGNQAPSTDSEYKSESDEEEDIDAESVPEENNSDVESEEKAAVAVTDVESSENDSDNDDESNWKTKPKRTRRYLGEFHQITQEKSFIYRSVKHEIQPSFNAVREPRFDCFTSYPVCAFSLPTPLYVAKASARKIDLCHKRTTDLANFEFAMRYRVKCFHSQSKRKIIKKAAKKGLYPNALFSFAEGMETNPDPYFNGRIDNYYTGGNLCDLGNEYVAHVAGRHLHKLTISKFTVGFDEIPRLVPKMTKTISKTDEIFQIKRLQLDDSPQGMCIRRMNNITIASFEDDSLETIVTLENSSEAPFISMAQSLVDNNTFLSSNLRQIVEVHDLSTSEVKDTIAFEQDPELDLNWNMLAPYAADAEVFLYANLKNFGLLDLRVPLKTRGLSAFHADLEICGKVSCVKASEFPHLFYVATTHKVYALDARYLPKTIKGKDVVVRWTPQMRSVPLILDSFVRDSQEYLVTSSPYRGDVRICETFRSKREHLGVKRPKTEEFNYTAPCLPYMPPSLEDTFKSVKKKAMCLEPELDIASRIGYCTTGVAFLDKRYLLTANSLGDVLGQRIDFDAVTANDEVFSETSVMTRYEDAVRKATPVMTLNCTTVENLPGVSKVLRCPKLDGKPIPPDVDVKIETRRKRFGRWKKPISVLHKYKDVLAADLLSIWDVEYEDVGRLKLHGQIPTEPSKNLVNNWLQQSAAESIDNVTAPMNSSTSDLTQASMLQDPVNISVLDTSLEPTPGRSQIMKVRKKYVKGF